ncbi:hypothetical protein IHP77_03125 [Enterococcus faecium]|uniref:hypothetical protein n=1 Tax=Enterococcus faecium TaxID=1352 RepID=UPI001783333C|nr:hypothetical protein [Enterococcus faecium]MBD9751468.1 hypothetical protein [Enterococcus faecium]
MPIMNKVVIMSKLFLFNSDNQLIQDNLWIVDFFADQEIEIAILARSASVRTMKNQIPENFENKIAFVDRNPDKVHIIV